MLTSAEARDLMTRGYCILRLVCDKARPGEQVKIKTLLETINFIKSLFRLSWTLLIVIIIILESQNHLIHYFWLIKMTKSIFACVYITCTGYRYRKSLLPDKGFRERERDLIFGTIIKTIKSPYLEARDTLIILSLVEQMVIFIINCRLNKNTVFTD